MVSGSQCIVGAQTVAQLKGVVITEILLYWSRGGGPLIATVLALGKLLGEAKASQTFILRVTWQPYSLILHSPSF